MIRFIAIFIALSFPYVAHAQIGTEPLSGTAMQQATGGLVGGLPVFFLQSLIVFLVAGGLLATPLFAALFKKMRHFSREEAFVKGWSVVRQYKWHCVGILVCGQLVSLLLSVISSFSQIFFIKIIFSVLSWVVFVAAIAQSAKIFLALFDSKEGNITAYKTYILDWKTLLSFSISFILYAIGIVLGSILLVVPGIFVAALFLFFPFFILEKGAHPLAALKMSFQMTKGSRLDLSLLVVLCTAINIAGVLVFFVGLLITIPFTFFVITDVYRQLSKAQTVMR